MRKYTDNSVLQEFIEINNVPEIKKELINSIIFLLGNREEIHKAIAEAESKTDFAFEEHKDIAYDNKEATELLYSEIKHTLLRENYSRERFEELIDLYHEVYAHMVFEKEEEEKKPQIKAISTPINTQEKPTDPMSVVTKVVIALVAGYIIYRIIR